LNDTWRALADFCRRASRPSAIRGAHLAMRAVADALNAPDWERRFDFDIRADCAAEAIAAAMPEGAENLLRRLVLTLLSDRKMRRHAAAAAAKVSAEAGVTEGVLTALVQALDDETDPSQVGKILLAMAALGEDARPHIKAALERADPSYGMWLNWLLEGG